MNKYNEIMNNVSVDPAMKTRIMSAVSAAIKEQDSGTVNAEAVRKPEIRRTPEPAHISEIPKEEPQAPVRKKAKKTPVVVISSIAAGILVIAGVIFVFGRMNPLSKTKSADVTYSTTIANFAAGDSACEQEDTANYAAETEAYDEYMSEETTTPGLHGVTSGTDDKRYNFDPEDRFSLTTNVTYETGSPADYSKNEGMGDVRLDGITRSLPFEIKGTGSGQFSESITEEVFFGNDGEKVIIFTAPEGTDIVNEVFREIYDIFHQKQYEGVDGTTPGGIPVRFYRVPFGNVTELAEGETSPDVNAAVFNKNGNTCLIVFSDIQSVEVIGGVIDIW